MSDPPAEPRAGDTLLQVEDLRTYFFTRRGVVKAVDGVSFSVRRGETLALVGESGSGKSITCHSIIGLVPKPAGRIVSGRILFDGENLVEKTERQLREYRGSRIAMILQDPMTSLNPVFTVGDQVGEAIRIHQGLRGKPLRERLISMLRQVGIPSPEVRIGNYPHHLSGGMRQRVVGAIGLSCEPDLLIADEPTTSLDLTIQAQYLALLEELQALNHFALVFVTHDFGIVARVCDRAAVMYAGNIVELGTVRALFDRPQHPYTRALLDSLPRMGRRKQKLPFIAGQPPSLLDPPPGCRFASRCPEVFARCRTEMPPESRGIDGHMVRCWRRIEEAAA
jgi:oligopeptide/dipeptide ABC transporter ATP-binding protein